MMKVLRWTARLLGGLILAVGLLCGGIALWLYAQDPETVVDAPPAAYRLVSERREAVLRNGEARLDLMLIFRADSVAAPLRMTVSLPADIDAQRNLPVLLLLGGLDSGRESLDRMPPLGRNAMVGFEYARNDLILDRSASVLSRAMAVRDGAVETPAQIAAALAWLGAQPWADETRISILGYSLGAIFAPAGHRAAERAGVTVAADILAFGGADLDLILPYAIKFDPPALRRLAAGVVALMLRPIDPRFHLPYLRGRFMLIEAEEDELIPPAAQALFVELTPEPKTVHRIPGDHINPRDTVVLMKVVDLSTAWLLEVGAANVPTP
ncbi:MAG: hypothetical protein HOH66_12975 [Rhodospirillaceae bacterium]|jgi:dienelactone hydrolase|nr:hypothetical protein [Rhodospirillaceae bacterium]MBT6118771.1 hypothetical protein [Rhodospirillaceae bacterium]